MCSKIPKKELILLLLISIFKKGMIFLSENDKEFKRITEELPDGFSFKIAIKHTNIHTLFVKTKGVFRYDRNLQDANLTLEFNNLCSAFLVFAGIIPQHRAFAEHRLTIWGNIAEALIITNAINRLQSVIFPDFISKKLIKEFKKSTLIEKSLFVRFYISELVK